MKVRYYAEEAGGKYRRGDFYKPLASPLYVDAKTFWETVAEFTLHTRSV